MQGLKHDRLADVFKGRICILSSYLIRFASPAKWVGAKERVMEGTFRQFESLQNMCIFKVKAREFLASLRMENRDVCVLVFHPKQQDAFSALFWNTRGR